ncbi:MAG: phosphotransferase, partial [Candidatus Marinimicrobia bacterium]|nr:phosphotransferase [Candidatus Neomarinimicrobiota bacterium]
MGGSEKTTLALGHLVTVSNGQFQLVEELARSFWTGREAVEAVQNIKSRESHRLAELETEHSLVHGDFNPTNKLVLNGAVSGILDREY